MKLEIDNETEFENVYIFIADALRYSSTPRELSDENTVVKTVSSSPVSCSAFPTMVTGLYPPQHGVHDFSGTFSPDIPTIFDFVPGDVPCYMGVGPIVNSIASAAHYNDLHAFISDIREIETPFLVFDRELITHSPYGYDLSGAHIDDEEREFTSVEEYWKQRKNSPNQIDKEYEMGATHAVKRFKNRIKLLRERDLLESTLVIFTADHGEHLGEYGVYGHSPILSPESVYVPTIFYNDSVTVEGDFMGHIDLLPTIASVMDVPIEQSYPGYDLLDGAPDDRLIFNGRVYNDSEIYGGWDRHGGHTFFEGSSVSRVRYALGQLVKGPRSVIHRQNPIQAAYHTLNRDRQFGRPEYSRSEIKRFCEDIRSATVEQRHTDLDTEAKDRLRDLGYIDEEI